MPHAEAFVTVTPPNPRALSGERLAELIAAKALALGYDGQGESPLVQVAESAAKALHMACERGSEGVVCAFGSLYLVGDYLRALENEGFGQTKRG